MPKPVAISLSDSSNPVSEVLAVQLSGMVSAWSAPVSATTPSSGVSGVSAWSAPVSATTPSSGSGAWVPSAPWISTDAWLAS